MQRRLSQTIWLLTLAPLLLSCVPFGGRDGSSSVAETIGAIAVVKGTVTDIDDHELDGVKVATVKMSEIILLEASGREPYEERILALAPGDEVTLIFSEGEYDKGESYAFFTGGWGIDEMSALYGHHLQDDKPAKEFGDNESYAGNSPADVLDCLVDALNFEGDGARLEVMIDVITRSNRIGEETPELTECEYRR